MKTFKVKQNSWHFRLLRFYDCAIVWRSDRDLCAYSRAVFGVVFITAVIGALILMVGSLAAAWICDTAQWLFSAVYTLGHPTYQMAPPGVALWVIIGASALLAGCARVARMYIDWYMQRTYEQPTSKEPGFVAAAYMSFKNKFCVKVEVE